jgi:hypothetical protein
VVCGKGIVVAHSALTSRQREVQVLTGLIDKVSGKGQSIVLVGDPGIGRWLHHTGLRRQV